MTKIKNIKDEVAGDKYAVALHEAAHVCMRHYYNWIVCDVEMIVCDGYYDGYCAGTGKPVDSYEQINVAAAGFATEWNNVDDDTLYDNHWYCANITNGAHGCLTDCDIITQYFETNITEEEIESVTIKLYRDVWDILQNNYSKSMHLIADKLFEDDIISADEITKIIHENTKK